MQGEEKGKNTVICIPKCSLLWKPIFSIAQAETNKHQKIATVSAEDRPQEVSLLAENHLISSNSSWDRGWGQKRSY